MLTISMFPIGVPEGVNEGFLLCPLVFPNVVFSIAVINSFDGLTFLKNNESFGVISLFCLTSSVV